MINKSVFITGAAQGIGEAIARRMVADGVQRLALTDINEKQLNQVADELRDAGCEVIAIPADLSDVGACRLAVAAAERSYDSLDIVVNAAGLTLRGSIYDVDEGTFDRLISVNVRAPMFVMQAALPAMIQAERGGVIVNISSMNSHGGPSFLLPYSASKAALNTITKNVANTVRWHRIRVHAINLGWTVTPAENETQMKVHGRSADWATKEGGKQPFGRLLECRDAAGLCSFLASDAAAMMTGCVIDQEQWVSGTVPSQPDDADCRSRH